MPAARNHTLDHIKAIACLTIVCHHLAFYGPMTDVLRPVLPALLQWLDVYGRMAVQVFLVLGGYLAAAALAPQGQGSDTPPHTLWSKRFVRLCLPYCAALIVALLVNESVRYAGFDHASVSANPSWSSVLAHLLLVQSIGGWEALSAGVWYVAIDFQLYALCVLWFWLSSRATAWPWLGKAGVLVLAALSLWHWNLDSSWDNWALYFVGAYALGMMAWWAAHSPQRNQRWLWVLAIAALGAVALQMAWRDRIALATVSALVLAMGGQVRWPTALRGMQLAPLAWIGQRSYSIFLIHFPVSLLVNACVHLLWPDSVAMNTLGVLLAIGLSIAAGAVLYAWTEHPRASWKRLHLWQLTALSAGMAALAANTYASS